MQASPKPRPRAKTPATILECAAKLIEKNGWWKGAYKVVDSVDGTTKYCVVGAIRECGMGDAYASFTNQPTIDARAALVRELDLPRELDLYPYASLTDWNDYTAASQEEVVSKLRAAAKQLRREARERKGKSDE